MTLICTKNPVSGDQNNSIKTTPLRSLLRNNILTRHFSERRVDNSHLEKGKYHENCRAITQARDRYISSRFNEENRTMPGICKHFKHCVNRYLDLSQYVKHQNNIKNNVYLREDL
jgi:hypothetical protein